MNPRPATPEGLEQRVIRLIAAHARLREADVTIDSRFRDLGIDSFDAMELILEFEEAFGVSVPADSAKYVKTVREVVTALAEALAAPVA